MRLVGFLGIFLVIGCEPGGAPLRTTEHAGSKLPVAPIFVSPAPPPARDAKGPPPTKRRAEKRYALRELSTEAPAALGAAIPVPQRVYRTDCEKPAPMHGFFRGEPVVATFGVRGDRLTLALESITSKTTMKFRGRSKGNVCGGPSFAFEGRAGRIEKIDRGEPAKLNVEIFLPDSFEDVRDDVGSITVTRSRLKIEGRDATRPDDLALELWEVAEDPQKVLEPYRAGHRCHREIDR
jgi:hypothetical protein